MLSACLLPEATASAGFIDGLPLWQTVAGGQEGQHTDTTLADARDEAKGMVGVGCSQVGGLLQEAPWVAWQPRDRSILSFL